MKKLILFACAFIILATASAQEEYAFKVLVNKGQNSVKAGNDWEPIKVGAKLTAADEVKLSNNAYLGLVHFSGKPLELKQAGTFKVANLASRISKETSVVSKYAEFLLSSNEGRKNKLSATGAVSRGFDQIRVFLPEKATYIFGDSLAIGWTGNGVIQGPFVVTIRTLFGDELKRLETADSSVMINFGDEKLARENDITIIVEAKGRKSTASDQRILRRYSASDRQRVMAQYEEIAPAVSENTAFNHWILARFFEERELIADAASALQLAVWMEPDVETYREDFEAFLLRNALKLAPATKD